MQSTIKAHYDSIFREHFGYPELKREQFEIIYKLLNDKKDVCAILATGYGKSICYQLPFLITNKSVIVVSPLLSLMSDQKASMEKLKIPVCCFNSDYKIGDKMKNITNILNGNHRLIYMTPEYLISCESFIKQLYENGGIAMVCIDEAHCTSSWGNDFRESYLKLNVIKEWVPDVPILALTATASERVRQDICTSLSLRNPTMIIGSFNRPNLYIKVSAKRGEAKSDLYELLSKYRGEYIIIYCKTREDTEKTARVVNSMGIKSFAYHAGLPNGERDTIQRNFNSGQYKCIIATIAFGMGINVPNVRLVVHYSCPKNLESYYQEIGRAGRDGKYSECHLLYSTKDFIINRFFIKDIANVKYREYQEQEIRNIEKYVYTTECRRKVLLANFGESINTCTNCDNCSTKGSCKREGGSPASGEEGSLADHREDLTLQSYKVISLVHQLRGKFGGGTYTAILRGSSAKNMELHKDLEVFGSGKEYPADFWKTLVRVLIINEYLKEVQIAKKFGSTIECTKKATEWLGKMNKYDLSLDSIKGCDRLVFTLTNEMGILKRDTGKGDTRKGDTRKGDTGKQNADNHNSKWTHDQEDRLLNDLALNKKIRVISGELGRTDGSIRSRLKQIACRLYSEGKSLEEISRITKLGEDKITYQINMVKQLNIKGGSKKIIVKGKAKRELAT
jgi:Werner syndrome ATP-dependent helicase